MREVSRTQVDARWSRPERVVLAVSVDKGGKADIIALGWKMKTSGVPPMVAISVGKTRYSYKLISEGKEFILAVPGENMWEEVLYCGTHSGREVDKFRQTGLTPLPAKFVSPPLIKECIVNLECKVTGELDTGDHTVFAGEILNYWGSEDQRRNLLSISRESGYEFLGGGKGYRFGVIKR